MELDECQQSDNTSCYTEECHTVRCSDPKNEKGQLITLNLDIGGFKVVQGTTN